MNLSTYIAKRYFFSRSSGNAVNIISAVSMLGIMVGTAALIIVLSAFNGLESLVKGFYEDFDPDIKVSLQEGKYFKVEPEKLAALQQLPGIEKISLVLEERVLLTFRDKEYIATIKGVDTNYSKVSNVANSVISGYYEMNPQYGASAAVLGMGVSYYLGYSRMDFESPISVFVPRENNGSNFANAFAEDELYPTGIFRIQPEFDDKFLITPLAFVRDLLDRPSAATAWEFKLYDNARIDEVKESIKAEVGSDFKVQDRAEQQEMLLKVMRTENLFTFLVFALILAISTFTIIGSIIMLMLDKRQNIFTLWAMGTELRRLQQIFFKTAMLICLTGATIGLALGVGIIVLQDQYGILALGPGYALESYPVELQMRDVLTVSLTVIVLSAITCWFTARRLSENLFRPGSAGLA